MTGERKPSVLDALREYGNDADRLENPDVRELLGAYASQRPDSISALESLGIVRREEGGIELTDRSKSLAMDLGLEPGTGLSMSGSGYRSMLFQLGVLWRMNDAGLLPKLDQIASVSTASVTAAWLGLRWSRLDFGPDGTSRFGAEVVDPIREFAGRTIDVRQILLRMAFSGAGKRLADSLDKHLFHGATLDDLPDRPQFVLGATSLESGGSWRFAKTPSEGQPIGERRGYSLALAVAASTALPPFLGPVSLQIYSREKQSDPAASRRPGPDEVKVSLVDGALSDRFGLEPNWERYRNVLVSDGSPAPRPSTPASEGFTAQITQTLTLLESQGHRLWKRLLIEAYRRGDRGGAYWGIGSGLEGYADATLLPVSEGRALELAQIPTRLAAIEPQLQERLINWGYALTDSALRRHVVPDLPRPKAFPYPGGV